MLLLKVVLFFNLLFILILASYPIFAKLMSKLYKKADLKSKKFIQPVSIIIACYNEEKYIKQKIDSFLDQDEWIEGSEIIIVSAGSTDATNDILSDYSQNAKVKVIYSKTQLSKIAAVNLAVKKARHDFFVFSDCRQTMKKGAVRQLLHNFNDPGVGTVTATLLDSGNARQISLRNVLNYIAHCESEFDSCLNVFGALYAQRRSVFRTFPTDLLFDDLFVVVSTILQKKRLVMDAEAIIYDVPFQKYYMPERIQRLARGLLIFLTSHFKMILQLPTSTLLRFLVFKYFKLLLPFVLLCTIIALVILAFPSISFSTIFMLLLMVIIFLSITVTRKLLFHFITINYHFLKATLYFFCWIKDQTAGKS